MKSGLLLAALALTSYADAAVWHCQIGGDGDVIVAQDTPCKRGDQSVSAPAPSARKWTAHSVDVLSSGVPPLNSVPESVDREIYAHCKDTHPTNFEFQKICIDNQRKAWLTVNRQRPQ